MVTVTVPATSANVGAGFDSLGLAVSMHNVFTFEESDRIQISSVDGTHVPAGSNNLVYRSARVVYDQLGIPLKGLRITQRNDIPMARGRHRGGHHGRERPAGRQADRAPDADAGDGHRGPSRQRRPRHAGRLCDQRHR